MDDIDWEFPFRISNGQYEIFKHSLREWVPIQNMSTSSRGKPRRFISWRIPGLPSLESGRIAPYSRIVWRLHYGRIPDGLQVDHIDCNPLNDDISNLRLLTPSENAKAYQAWRKLNPEVRVLNRPQRKRKPKALKPLHVSLNKHDMEVILCRKVPRLARLAAINIIKLSPEDAEYILAIIKLHKYSKRPIICSCEGVINAETSSESVLGRDNKA